MIPKFRAWDKTTSKLHVVNGIYCDNKKIHYIDDNRVRFVGFDNVIIMQSTGLKDKNGKEIFEGDVVSRNSGMPSVVEFGKWIYEEDFGYKIKNIGFYLNSSYDDDEFFQAMDYEDIRKNYEVIGNIYENPELLEEKE